MAIDISGIFLSTGLLTFFYKASHLQKTGEACYIEWLAGCVCGLTESFSGDIFGCCNQLLSVIWPLE